MDEFISRVMVALLLGYGGKNVSNTWNYHYWHADLKWHKMIIFFLPSHFMGKTWHEICVARERFL